MILASFLQLYTMFLAEHSVTVERFCGVSSVDMVLYSIECLANVSSVVTLPGASRWWGV